MGRLKVWFVALLLGLAFSGCAEKPESAAGFRLPDGDPVAGREVFLTMGCTGCHTIAGADLPAPAEAGPVSIELGGRVSKVKTYGDLVTSVINPSHRLPPGYPIMQVTREGESLMPVLNEAMTVAQLIDVVAFLQSHYKVVAPRFVTPRYRERSTEASDE